MKTLLELKTSEIGPNTRPLLGEIVEVYIRTGLYHSRYDPTILGIVVNHSAKSMGKNKNYFVVYIPSEGFKAVTLQDLRLKNEKIIY